MNLDETIELLAQVALVDDRVVKTSEIEQRAQVTMWAATLRDVPLAFAGEAVARHYAESAYPVMPRDVAARWRAEVRSRLERSTGTFEPTDHPHVDPDDVDGYMTALRSHRRAIAGGDAEPVALAELMPAVGDRLGGGRVAELVPANDTYRQVREQHYPRRERPAGPPERAVHCPNCGASPNRPCRLPHNNKPMTGTHPSRRDVWEAQQMTEGADA